MPGLRARLLHWMGVPTEPTHVEKASRRERWKRQVWMVVSTLASVWFVWIVAAAIVTIANLGTNAALFAILSTFVVGFYIDIKYVFPWGVERFDLVPPWQFRDETDT